MSGSTIGGFVGAAIGFWFGAPQWGFMIGSAIGGYVDPQKVEGPRLTDAQTQSSNEGVPRPIIYGTAAVGGNVIQCGPLVEHKTSERAGKGGPVQTTYTYTRTVAIRICEAAPLGGEMKLRRVWKDDKLIYDASGSGLLDADSATFASILTFYSGAEDQLPDPSLEALPAENGGGVGNVPSHRGTCYAVLTDLDCTDRQGAVSQFRWEVCSEATIGPAVQSYDELSFSGPSPWAADANGKPDPRKTGVTYQYAGLHYNDDYNEPGIVWRDTIDEAIEDQQSIYGVSSIGIPALVGWTKRFGGMGGDLPTSPFESVTGFEDRYVLGLVFMRYAADITDAVEVFEAGGDNAQCTLYTNPVFAGRLIGNDTGVLLARNVTVQQASVSPSGAEGTYGCYDGGSYNSSGVDTFNAYIIACRPVLSCTEVPPVGAIQVPDASGFYMVDGQLVDYGGSCTETAGTFKQLSLLTDGLDGDSLGTAKILTYPLGPVLKSTDANYSNEAFWTASYDAAVAAGYMPSGMTYSSAGSGGANTYPRTTSTACLCTPSLPPVIPGTVPLSSIVADLCDRADVTSEQVDVSSLEGIPVRGYPIARQTSPAEAIRPLQDVFAFDFPEWGNSGESTTKLRAILRGGSIKVTITDDDLVDNDDDDDGTRAQQVEFPRKVTLSFADPDANYETASQPAERTTENIRAVGEQQISTSVVLNRNEAAVVADKLLKRLWEEANGRISRELPEEFSQYTPSDAVSYLGKRWRIEKAERADGTNRWDMVRDRASAASSTATGSPAPTPTPPVSTIRGPTIAAYMNLPSLRSADNVPGMYVAAQGLLPGWAGADIYLSVDGGVTEQKVMTILNPAVLGELAVDCDVDGADSTGLLEVQVLEGGQLDSITEAQMDARLNGFALITDDVAEVGQFQDATETSTEGLYDLTNVLRGQLGTPAAAHSAGDRFVLLDGNVRFLPLDAALGGQTLIFRAVSIGTAPANNPTTSIVFDPPVFVIDGGGA